MAPRTDDSLRSAWRALEDSSRGDGWRTIPIETVGPYRILAGRHFQGGEESLLVGFTPTGIAIDSGPLPRGRGFRVESVKEEMPGRRTDLGGPHQTTGRQCRHFRQDGG